MHADLLGTAKPKTHHLTHYPEAIANFGPPMNYWTARYESRHRIAKSSATSAKNFKEIHHYKSNFKMEFISLWCQGVKYSNSIPI